MLFTELLHKKSAPSAVQGRIYFRSDSRPPELIFKEGFVPRIKAYGKDWWKEAIKSRGYINDRGIDDKAVDADPAVCICMSTKIESAAIFPLDNEETYIYAIALPDFTQIEYVGSGDGEVHLSRTQDTPTDNKEIVVDLNELQTVQTRNINDFFKSSMTLSAGWPLHAYEAIAFQVLPSSIICAIKCTRKMAEEQLSSASVDKKITLHGDIMQNLNFCDAQILKVGAAHHLRYTTIDYSLQRTQAIQQLTELKKMNDIKTPNRHYGFGGKTF
ncbi:hypothetical protein [Legionella cherrii]|uniref:Uncharacterized protein n=1 Tax=Legionella cherrii TaxID=28084 RepID=A0A0W0S9G2_9GAMM|nr:hypothetical protein [Legionella cherrii]KTC80236.1 hypothetical protein Lche_2256 [Legionella cherrii]VEB38738.1 Uncharacterised protein [Legionella cherrii]